MENDRAAGRFGAPISGVMRCMGLVCTCTTSPISKRKTTTAAKKQEQLK